MTHVEPAWLATVAFAVVLATVLVLQIIDTRPTNPRGVPVKRTTLTAGERDPLVVRASITTAVTAVVHVAVVLGLPLDNAAELAIAGAVDAVGLVVVLLVVRPAVTPNAKVIARVTTAGDVVAGEAAVAPTGSPLDVQANGVDIDTLTGRMAVLGETVTAPTFAGKVEEVRRRATPVLQSIAVAPGLVELDDYALGLHDEPDEG